MNPVLRCSCLVMFLVAVGLFNGAAVGQSPQEAQGRHAATGAHGKIVVANRGAGTITIIDARDATRIANVALPAGTKNPEPMYVVNTTSFGRNLVWVGDRANNRVVIYDGRTFDLLGSVPVGAGVFHMWANPFGSRIWVVNDIDNTASVIDVAQRRAIATVPMPADLVALGAKPHDVVLDTFGHRAYVSMIGSALAADVVVQFDGRSGRELNRASVGKDPHLSYNARTRQIFSPNQGTSSLFVLDSRSLVAEDVIAIPAAHGAFTSGNGRWFFVTNIAGGGQRAVFAVDTRNRTIEAVADTGFTTPHNVALTSDGRMLYVTHSGANDRVSAFRVDSHGRMTPMGDIQTGANPFGLAFVE